MQTPPISLQFVWNNLLPWVLNSIPWMIDPFSMKLLVQITPNLSVDNTLSLVVWSMLCLSDHTQCSCTPVVRLQQFPSCYFVYQNICLLTINMAPWKEVLFFKPKTNFGQNKQMWEYYNRKFIPACLSIILKN